VHRQAVEIGNLRIDWIEEEIRADQSFEVLEYEVTQSDAGWVR
jgi:hypothetical protein